MVGLRHHNFLVLTTNSQIVYLGLINQANIVWRTSIGILGHSVAVNRVLSVPAVHAVYIRFGRVKMMPSSIICAWSHTCVQAKHHRRLLLLILGFRQGKRMLVVEPSKSSYGPYAWQDDILLIDRNGLRFCGKLFATRWHSLPMIPFQLTRSKAWLPMIKPFIWALSRLGRQKKGVAAAKVLMYDVSCNVKADSKM